MHCVDNAYDNLRYQYTLCEPWAALQKQRQGNGQAEQPHCVPRGADQPGGTHRYGKIGKTEAEPGIDPKLSMTIEELDFSVRSNNCLRRAGINFVGDLTKKSEADLKKVRNLGTKSLDEVKKKSKFAQFKEKLSKKIRGKSL